MFLNIAGYLVNRIDPDQTSCSTCILYSRLFIRLFWTITHSDQTVLLNAVSAYTCNAECNGVLYIMAGLCYSYSHTEANVVLT